MADKIVGHIYKTKEYSKFKLTKENRRVSENNTKKIASSIKEKDMGSSFPIVVDKRYVIKDGQHRFTTRRELGLPVYYFFTTDDIDAFDVMLANKNSFKWKIVDYLETLAKTGDETAKRVLKDAEDYGLPVNVFLAAVGISVSDEMMAKRKLKYTRAHQEQAKEFLGELSIFKTHPFWNTQRFIKAFKHARKLNNYKPERMVESLTKHADMLTRQTSRTNYVFKILDTYNYGRKKEHRIPYPSQDLFEGWGDALGNLNRFNTTNPRPLILWAVQAARGIALES